MITNTQLRIKTSTYKKVKKIAKTNERSINKQIIFIIEQYIKDYEKVNGQIELKEEE